MQIRRGEVQAGAYLTPNSREAWDRVGAVSKQEETRKGTISGVKCFQEDSHPGQLMLADESAD